jgi:hypothetical protein
MAICHRRIPYSAWVWSTVHHRTSDIKQEIPTQPAAWRLAEPFGLDASLGLVSLGARERCTSC